MPKNFSIIDSHCHLDRFYKAGELESVLKQASEAGVDRMITIGTSDEDWSLYAQLHLRYSGVVDYTVGLHPCHVDETWEKQVAQVRPYFASREACPVGLGEIGLDYFHLPQKDVEKAEKLKSMQMDALRYQLEIVNEFDCPVVIHSRGAFGDCVRELDAAKINWSQVVFHCFVENAEAMKLLNDRGGRGSFTGIITFKNAQDVRDAALAQGLDKLMVETDAPYLAPEPHRGKPCFPAYTALTAKYCAQLLGIREEELAEATRKNTEGFFGLKIN
jgi:TatD DNase family protein